MSRTHLRPSELEKRIRELERNEKKLEELVLKLLPSSPRIGQRLSSIGRKTARPFAKIGRAGRAFGRELAR